MTVTYMEKLEFLRMLPLSLFAGRASSSLGMNRTQPVWVKWLDLKLVYNRIVESDPVLQATEWAGQSC